jgi:hypothetical protein
MISVDPDSPDPSNNAGALSRFSTGLRKGNMKIAVYGFGSMPVIWRHLYEIARSEGIDITWCVILTAPNWRHLIYDILAKAEVLDVYRELPRVSASDLSCLGNYQGSFCEDVDADKRPNPWESGPYRIGRGVDYYRLYKSFFLDRKVTHLLMPTVESSAAKIAVAVAVELGILPMVPTDLRNLTGTYFASDPHDRPPTYGVVTDELRTQAKRLIKKFQQQPLPARALPLEFSLSEKTKLQDFTPPLPTRLIGYFQRAIERPDLFHFDSIRVATMWNIPFLRKSVRNTRKRLNAIQFDISSLEELPRKYVYYPLHYSPEASVNSPAPYFLDQIRAIDALRYAMPNDHVLLVKEHPACVPMRPLGVMRQIRRLPGVEVARYDLPSVEIIKRAGLTVTVTGTAALEATLLGHPALTLASYLPAHITGKVVSIGSLRDEIARALNSPMPEQTVIDRIAKLLSVRYPFICGSTKEAGEPILSIGNMRRFLFGLLDHIEREMAFQERGVAD